MFNLKNNYYINVCGTNSSPRPTGQKEGLGRANGG